MLKNKKERINLSFSRLTLKNKNYEKN